MAAARPQAVTCGTHTEQAPKAPRVRLHDERRMRMNERTTTAKCRVLGAAAGALLAGTAVALTAPAAAAAPGPAGGGSYCAYLVGKTAADPAPSVLRQACSSRSDDDARTRLRAASSTLLMTWYADAGWRGTSAKIYGAYGTCDSAGYGFAPSSWWETHMSSIRGSGQCNKVRLTNIAGTYSSSYSLPASFGSKIYNDNVGYVKTWHG